MQYASDEGLELGGKIKSLTRDASANVVRDFRKISFKEAEVTRVFVQAESLKSGEPGFKKVSLTDKEKSIIQRREKEVNKEVAKFKGRHVGLGADIAILFTGAGLVFELGYLIYTALFTSRC